MNKYEAETMISHIDDKYVFESYEYIKSRNKKSFKLAKKAKIAAASFAAVAMVSASTLAVATAAGSIPAYDILYSLYPQMAQKLTPINVACEDNGIKMEVESVYIHDDTAEIYISMKDLEGNRIDETIDLFDSYTIDTSNDSVGTCSLIGFDAENKEATFLIYLQHMDKQKIAGKKLSFRVSKFLCGKQKTTEELSEIALNELDIVINTQNDVEIRGRGGISQGENGTEQTTEFLTENEAQTFSPVEGATVTAYGFIENQLHIQVYYEDILNTDNHGSVYLKNANGDTVDCYENVSFWDENYTGSYEEYVFNIDSEADLDNYSVCGYFNTCQNFVTGDWSVTFPVKNME